MFGVRSKRIPGGSDLVLISFVDTCEALEVGCFIEVVSHQKHAFSFEQDSRAGMDPTDGTCQEDGDD